MQRLGIGLCLYLQLTNCANHRAGEVPAPLVSEEPSPIDAGAEATTASAQDSSKPSLRLLGMYPTDEAHTVLPTADDLSGIWHEVPAAASHGPLRREPPCYEGLGWIALQQEGEIISILRRFAEPMQGMLPAEQIVRYEHGSGSRKQDALELNGELVRETTPREDSLAMRREVLQHTRWSLQFDRTSGHLIGNRDGVSIRLAPMILVSPPGDPTMRTRCGPPPA